MSLKRSEKASMDWTVVGAGPAGIAAIGKLIDANISPNKIGWIDPYFQVGDLGRKWGCVSSNTQVDLFLRFLLGYKSFLYKSRPEKFPLDEMDPQNTCLLKYVVEPLQWITNHFRKKVNSFEENAISLNLFENLWEINTKSHRHFSKNVVLAIGAEEKKLAYSVPETISLETALDFEILKASVNSDDTVAVFGSSHSAVLILANLINTKAKRIVNFYRSPNQYAVDMGDWILFDNTGLKGFAAKWAKQHLDGKHPARLKRIHTSDLAFEEVLAGCNKVVYAVGFERRKVPVLEQFSTTHYNDKTGIIAPGLFGLGIAFPQAMYDPLMNLEYRVGIWKFMDYLNTIFPIWLKYAPFETDGVFTGSS